MEIQKAMAAVTRGRVECHTEEDLRRKLGLKRPLRVKLGVDPTSPDLHLGHTVILNRLRAFQDLGHTAVLIIGDFTARVGDPSGRDSTRPTLSIDQVKANAATYQAQAFKVLDKSKTELRFNSEWLEPFMREGLFSVLQRYTVGQLLQREDFSRRQEKGLPITVLEILYPILQGYDSVAVNADIELGGNDQLFNLLMGRQMQKDFNQEPQVALTFPLLVGLDGVKKMSKSYGNSIAISGERSEGPRSMFGQVMSISDDTMRTYYELLTDRDMAEVRNQHPLEAKKELARFLVERFYGAAAAKNEREYFVSTFSKKELPKEVPSERAKRDAQGKKWIVEPRDGGREPAEVFSWSQLLVKLKLSESRKEAQRLILQGGFKINGETLREDYITEDFMRAGEYTLQVGKHKFLKVNLD